MFKSTDRQRRNALEYYWRIKTSDPEAYARRRVLETKRRRERRAEDPAYKALTDSRSLAGDKKRYIRNKATEGFLETHNRKHQSWIQGLRRLVMENLGDRCACCGEMDPGFLTIDHIGGTGREHRRRRQGTAAMIYADIRDSGYDRTQYQILCMNCNWATRYGKPCPHVRKADLAMADEKTLRLASRMPGEAYKPSRKEFNFAEAVAIMEADELVRLERAAQAAPGQWVRTETMGMLWVSAA